MASDYNPYAELQQKASAPGIPRDDAELQTLAEQTRDRLAGDGTVGNPITAQFAATVKNYYDQSQSPLAAQMLAILKDKGHL